MCSLLVPLLLGLMLSQSVAPRPRPTDSSSTSSRRERSNSDDEDRGFEVWITDQSNSPLKSFGGFIHIYDGAALEEFRGNSTSLVPVASLDMSATTAQLCMNETGANPVRPHMIVFNKQQSHAVLAFVASGHVVFFDAATRRPLRCFQTSIGVGGARQAHAAWPTPDSRYVIVANQNGKLFERIVTDYATNTFSHDTAATLSLTTCTTPNGYPCQDPSLRPYNAPICPYVGSLGSPAFVSLRGGGMLLFDPYTTPMAIVAEYDKVHVRPNGCGFVEANGYMYANAGGATASNLEEFAIYRFPLSGYSASNPPNTPAPELLFLDESRRDAHGGGLTGQSRYLWMLDRMNNNAEVFDAVSGQRVNTVNFTSSFSSDPAPDLSVLSPSGNRFFVTLRGPIPLSGDPRAVSGSTPGLGIVQLTQNGRSGFLKAIIRVSNIDATGVERSDPHGIALRRV